MDTHETHDSLVAFLYQLLRDYVTSGAVEEILEDQKYKLGSMYTLSNGFLAQYAKDVAMRLRRRDELPQD